LSLESKAYTVVICKSCGKLIHLREKMVRLEDAQKEITKHDLKLREYYSTLLGEKQKDIDNLERREKVLEMKNWFKRMHNELYKKHEETDGLIAKFLEAHMGAIDQAWCNFRLIFQDELKEASEG